MIRKFNAGEFIFREGETGVEAYLIKSGHVSIWTEREGERVHLAVRDEGEIVGEMSLLDETACSASVTAESDVELEIITREDLERMLAGAPALLSQIMHQLMESMRNANELVSMYSARFDEEGR